MGGCVRLLAFGACLAACAAHSPRTASSPSLAAAIAVPVHAAVIANPVPQTAPPPLACLVRYYDAATARRDERGWSLVLPDGTAIPFDDGRTKSVYERFESPDVEDLFELVYPHGAIHPITVVDFDPGRIRIDPLLLATYGKTPKDVQSALVSVPVGGKYFAVHRKIAAPLRRVAARVAVAMRRDPSLARFFESPGGTFNWRRIAGTDTLSMHSWAIAIDLDTKRANYWRNETKREDDPLAWKNSYPQAIVDAFEAEGFVWGGRWYHFDTMHFEYRPELIDPECYPKR